MSKDVLEKTKEFLKKSFMENPHFSFDDWKIMYDHSILVLKFSLKIAETINCDKMVLSIGALLHDIGKTYKADEEILIKQHRKLGYMMSKKIAKPFYKQIKKRWEV